MAILPKLVADIMGVVIHFFVGIIIKEWQECFIANVETVKTHSFFLFLFDEFHCVLIYGHPTKVGDTEDVGSGIVALLGHNIIKKPIE